MSNFEVPPDYQNFIGGGQAVQPVAGQEQVAGPLDDAQRARVHDTLAAVTGMSGAETAEEVAGGVAAEGLGFQMLVGGKSVRVAPTGRRQPRASDETQEWPDGLRVSAAYEVPDDPAVEDAASGGRRTAAGGGGVAVRRVKLEARPFYRRPKVLAAAGAAAVLLTFGAVELGGGGGGISVEQAAEPGAMHYADLPGAAADRKPVLTQRLNEAREELDAYKPFIIAAAKDPRAGDPNAVPDHLDETIVQIALLFSGNPNSATGPVPIPASEQKKLLAQLDPKNADATLDKPQSPDQIIGTNLREAILQIRTVYAQWAGQKDSKGNLVNVGKPVTNFAYYYFSGGDTTHEAAPKTAAQKTGKLAEAIAQSWRSDSNLQIEQLLNSDTFANNGLAPTIGALVSDGLLQISNTGNNG